MSLGTDEKPAIELIHEAIDLGINYYDTADLYDKGVNEQILGKAIKGKRDKFVVATKVGNQWREDGTGWDWNPTRNYILKAVEESLRRLQTDRIDLYQLHGGTIDDPVDDTIHAFETLRQQGKILHYGISSIRPNVIREYLRRSNIVSVMMQYSLLDRRPEETCLPLLKENGKAVLVRGAIAQGMLGGKTAKAYLGHTIDEVRSAAHLIESISNDRRTPVQTALRFVLQHPAVSSVVAGIRTNEQLKEIVDTLSTPPLTNEELELLRENVPALLYSDHR